MDFLKDNPVPITDDEGAKLAKELLAIFTMVTDPPYFGKVLQAPAD